MVIHRSSRVHLHKITASTWHIVLQRTQYNKFNHFSRHPELLLLRDVDSLVGVIILNNINQLEISFVKILIYDD